MLYYRQSENALMDPLMGALYPSNGFRSDDQSISAVVDRSFVSRQTFQSAPDKCGEMHPLVDVAPFSNDCRDAPYTEEAEFSDAVFEYISRILMEEDIEEKTYMLQDSLDLLSAEKSFYEVLGKKYPPSPEPSRANCVTYNDKHSNDSLLDNTRYTSTNDSRQNGYIAGTGWVQNPSNYGTVSFERDISRATFQPNRAGNAQMLDLCGESQFVRQFRMGVEESSKFLPNQANTKLLSPNPNGKIDKANRLDALKRKVSLHREEGNMEERSSKQAFVHEESELRSENFDIVLLSSQGEGLARLLSLRASLKNGVNEITPKIEEPKGGRRRGKKKRGKVEVVDVRTLLIRCAQAVASNDHRSANALLNEIRKHASPFGNGTQRLAHYFADGLEARFAGTGSQIYRGLVNKKTAATDMLNAYQLYLAACPFQRTSNVVSNLTILDTVADKTRVHVIDFGILYGFQWPTLIQHLARRPRPTKLRITGIDLPQPGFRPAERVEETGRRLANYAESFKVPFEYNAIAKRWEFIKLEELKIDRDEVTIVNCLYRFENLFDETITEESSRDIVLNLITRAQPDLFIHGVINGTHNAPFFVTRFREALHHFSSLFDMLDTIIPRENRERMLIEKDMFGREALNSIACEGWERVERPETYKQWQLRNLRAGFGQVPLSRKVVRFTIDRIVSSYHKDFVVDEVSKWLLLGWKGRFLCALSTWKPAQRDRYAHS
ncbi:scarecrow-like protein 9 [Syzygium oleosum]|uniref:scarecrow-like protein 9 n=1 Tax=Syzygium oleosum TaxID=219896 RepID=UPI0024B9BBE8|nr:scarecrow-like protein 9 [Syzygium oleosum]